MKRTIYILPCNYQHGESNEKTVYIPYRFDSEIDGLVKVARRMMPDRIIILGVGR